MNVAQAEGVGATPHGPFLVFDAIDISWLAAICAWGYLSFFLFFIFWLLVLLLLCGKLTLLYISSRTLDVYSSEGPCLLFLDLHVPFSTSPPP